MTIIKLLCACLLLVCSLWAQIPLDPEPYWSYFGGKPHSLGLGDINDDGFPDLAVANEGFPVYLFVNDSGALPDSPSWQSSNTDYNFALALGDYDNDGDLDLATGGPGLNGAYVKLYENLDGTLDSNPVWTAGSRGAMDLAWGDVDGDGDLDLAAADMVQYPCLFINNNGTFGSEPDWEAGDYNNDLGVTWFDVDKDGDLDLAVIRTSVRIYYNNDGMLETNASWVAQPPDTFDAGGACAGDINDDGYLDLFVANGTTYDPCPDFVYMNDHGTLELSPSWVSVYPALTWKAMFGDIDGDGNIDVATSPFYYDPPFVYLNNNGILLNYPVWFGNVNSGPGIALGDIDKEGEIQCVDTLSGNDTLKLFYLSYFPIHKLDTVKIDGIALPTSDYCYAGEYGWLSLKNIPASGTMIAVQYSYSLDMELAVSGADPYAVYLYNNTNAGDIEEVQNLNAETKNLQVYPNPFTGKTGISYCVGRNAKEVKLKIYDTSGRMVRAYTVHNSPLILHDSATWDGTDEKGKELPDGVYFLRLEANNFSQAQKIIKLK